MMQVQPRRTDTSILQKGAACLICKRKKRKCDASKPSCIPCTKAGIAERCVYPDWSQTMKQKERYWKEKTIELEITVGVAQKKHNDDAMELPRRTRSADEASGIGREISMLGGDSTEWWKRDELPDVMKDYLIFIFLNHASQPHFKSLVPSFISRLHLYPPSHPNYPTSSLLNTIYLLASFYLTCRSHPHHHPITFEMEAHFRQKALQSLARNLSMAENLVDFMCGTSMISMYFYSILNVKRAEYMIYGAMRLAFACNLHNVTSPYDFKRFPKSMLPPPTNQSDVDDRIAVFWTVWMVYKIGTVCSSDWDIPEELIMTPFYSPIVEKSSSIIPPTYTITSLYTPELTDIVADVSHDSILASKAKFASLCAKVKSLIVRGSEFGAVQLKDTPFAFSEEFRLVGSALLRLIATHPMSISASLTLSDESPFTSFRSQGCSRAQLAIALTLPRAFLIQLHGLFYNEDEYSHNMAFKAAREILDIARELEGDNESYWELPMNMGWGNACEVFHKEIVLIFDSETEEMNDEKALRIMGLREGMIYLRNMMQRMVRLYRNHGPALDYMNGLLARDEGKIGKLVKHRAAQLSKEVAEKIGKPVLRWKHY